MLIHLAFIVADIGGETSFAWLGIANTIAYAATAPFAGATSDLIGRRYVALAGAALNVIGMVVLGTAHRIDVAIGGMAIAGVGSGLAEVIGTAGITELAPVKSRGLYMGMAYTLILPAAASSGYGISYQAYTDMSRSAIFTGVDMEMGSVDLRHSQWRGIWNAAPVLLASTSHQLTRTQQTADTFSN